MFILRQNNDILRGTIHVFVLQILSRCRFYVLNQAWTKNYASFGVYLMNHSKKDSWTCQSDHLFLDVFN